MSGLGERMTVAEAVEALVVAARELAQAALELEKLVERAVQIPDVLVQLLGVDREVDPATATVSLRLSAQGADRVAELLSALRARHVDLGAVQAELTHRFGPFQLSIGREPRVGGGGQTASADDGFAAVWRCHEAWRRHEAVARHVAVARTRDLLASDYAAFKATALRRQRLQFANFSAPAPLAGAAPYRRSHALSPRLGRIAIDGVRLPILPIGEDEWGIAHDPR